MLLDPIIMVRDNVKYVVRPPTWAVIEIDVTETSRNFWIRSLTVCEREAVCAVGDSLSLFAKTRKDEWRIIAARVIVSSFNYVDIPSIKDNGPAWGLSRVPFRVTTGMAIRGLLAGPRIRITPLASEVPNAVREQYRNR